MSLLRIYAVGGHSGNGHEVSTSPFGVVAATGRLDFRGLVLPERAELRRITFRFADFTWSVMKRAWFESSFFTDILFDNSSLQILSEGGGNL